ncbi:MAG: HD domain-containing protein [Oscillospiraceae bacterium]|nr:HD domain-containing protein [Oscillospiraceae bacterium]
MTLPPEPARLITLLEQAGFSVYVVGGCVRDSLLGKQPEDWDLCTAATPQQASEILHSAGITVHETGLQHGTITAVIDGKAYEITSFRCDGAYTDHRRPDSVQFTQNLHEDLARRDFTINAMAFHPQTGLVDPFGGQADLQAGVIRCVGEPAQRFAEDALRILRALRFAATLGFAIEENTAQAAYHAREYLLHIAHERVQVELTKLLCGSHAHEILLAHREIIFAVLPELAPLNGFDQHTPWHCYDVYEHSCVAVQHVPPTPALRWAALLHDIGKPACFFMRDGTGHAHGHPAVSVQLTLQVCERLKFSRKLTQQVHTLVEHHELRLLEDDVAPARLRRLLGKHGGNLLLQLLQLNRADVCAQHPDKLYRLENFEPIQQAIEQLIAEQSCVTRAQLAVNGNDLMALGLRDKQLGQALDELLHQVIEGKLPNEREYLLTHIQQSRSD